MERLRGLEDAGPVIDRAAAGRGGAAFLFTADRDSALLYEVIRPRKIPVLIVRPTGGRREIDDYIDEFTEGMETPPLEVYKTRPGGDFDSAPGLFECLFRERIIPAVRKLEANVLIHSAPCRERRLPAGNLAFIKPLAGLTEKDKWQIIKRGNIKICKLYYCGVKDIWEYFVFTGKHNVLTRQEQARMAAKLKMLGYI